MRFMLSGGALTWYDSYSHVLLNCTWEQFSVRFLNAFYDSESDFSVRKRIEERKQGQNENVEVFVAAMLSLFEELEGDLSEVEKVRLIRRNLHSSLRNALLLVEIHSVEELCEKLKLVERNRSYAYTERREVNAISASARSGNGGGAIPKRSSNNRRNSAASNSTNASSSRDSANVSDSSDTNAQGSSRGDEGENTSGVDEIECEEVSVPNEVISVDQILCGEENVDEIIEVPVFQKFEGDPRPHLKVKIFNIEIIGLMDSGASCTVLGEGSEKLLADLGLIPRTSTGVITVADGNCQRSVGSEVSERLRKANLTINVEKSQFCADRLEYLGYTLSPEGIGTNDFKVSAIINLPVPRTVTQLRQILGMIGWFRRFLPSYATFSKPLTDLLKGKGKTGGIIWTPEADEAFGKLKELLTTAPILKLPDYSKPFIVRSDASDVGAGGMLIQEEDGQEKIEDGNLFKHCRVVSPLKTTSFKWKCCVRRSEVKDLIQKYHDSPNAAHLGFAKTYRRISGRFYWPSMRTDVRNYLKKCEVCKAVKSPNITLTPPMGSHVSASRPWEHIAMDFVGPLTKSSQGYRQLLVIIDRCTKFVLLYPLRNATTTTVIKVLSTYVFPIFGIPRVVFSDNGPAFSSTAYKSFLADLGIKQWLTPAYSPQSNPTERANRTIITSIRAYIEKKHSDWPKYLAEIGMAMRSSIHESAQYTPYFLNFGQEMIVNSEEYAIEDANNPPSIDERLKALKLARDDAKNRLRINIKRVPAEGL
uniref:RNA-directed DNA polymerase n=1 Tax=Lutzomyia longipalpis TaxID=7200 RepID=A0A1B0C8P4_LUTLO